MPIETTPEEAVKFFNQILGKLPRFYDVLNEACRKKYEAIEHYVAYLNNSNAAFTKSANTTAPSNNESVKKDIHSGSNSAQKSNGNNQNVQKPNHQQRQSHQPDASTATKLISNQQRDELQAFISERGLDIRDVCIHLGIDALTQISIDQLESCKGYIDDLATSELHA